MEKQDQREQVLKIRNLTTHAINIDGEVSKILNGVSFTIFKGEVLGIVGASGAGKSVLALSILNLVRKPLKIIEGQVFFKGKDLLQLSDEAFSEIRGKEITLVMQNAPGGMDPLRDMTFTTSQPYRAHVENDPIKEEIKQLVVSQLGKVAIADPFKISEQFAHQLSGGEAQRVKIASAIINNPDLVIADEPVSNLDVTVARRILDLLTKMKEKYHLTMLLITHDLGVIAEMADRVAIIYAGKLMEITNVDTLYYYPRHPYTQALFYATPSMAGRGKLQPIPGVEPNPKKLPSGCKFHPRCKYAIELCKLEEPAITKYKHEHYVACWRMDEVPDFERE